MEVGAGAHGMTNLIVSCLTCTLSELDGNARGRGFGGKWKFLSLQVGLGSTLTKAFSSQLPGQVIKQVTDKCVQATSRCTAPLVLVATHTASVICTMAI